MLVSENGTTGLALTVRDRDMGAWKRRAGTVVGTLVPIIPWTALFLINSHERQLRVHRALSAARKKIRGTFSPDLMELPT